MSLNHPIWGEGYVPAYQMSSMPYVTSSNIALGATKEFGFSYVTRFVKVKNTGAAANVVAVSFTQNGLSTGNSNFFILSGSEELNCEIRTNRVFISGSNGALTTFSLLAGLTGIPASNFLTVTGSNGFAGVG